MIRYLVSYGFPFGSAWFYVNLSFTVDILILFGKLAYFILCLSYVGQLDLALIEDLKSPSGIKIF